MAKAVGFQRVSGDVSMLVARSEDASMKLALIALGLLVTTGVVYAACVLC
jgi:hypothetical protein